MNLMKNKVYWHEVALIAVLLVMTLVKLLIFRTGISLNLLWWALGMILGFIFVFMDRLVSVYYLHPEDDLSVRFKKLVVDRKYLLGFELLLKESWSQSNLVMRSAVFVIFWFVIAIFTMTSSVNHFGRGFVLGIGTHLIYDLVFDFMVEGDKGLNRWFWQVKREVEREEQKWFLGIALAVYLLLLWNL